MNELTGDEYRDAMRMKIYEVTGPNLDSHGCFKNTTDNRMKMKGDCFECPNNLQTVHTSFSICSEIVGKLREHTELVNKEICIFNLEFIDALKYDSNVPLDKVWFVTDCQNKAKVAKYFGTKVIDLESFMKKDERKFDVVCMNPPYQAPKDKEHEGRGKCGKSLWEDFVKKSLGLVKENGYVCNIHPPRWRKPENKIGEEIKSLQLLYIKMYGLDAGREIFKCQTDFDWYILQNKKCEKLTEIIDQDNNSVSLKLCNVSFIPDININKVMKLIAKDNEEKCNVIHSYSAYETRKAWMSREKTDTNKYPCIYSIGINNNVSFWYSSKKEDFFGVPKVVFANGHTGIYIDEKGEFGLTQFACGISDSLENLSNIAKALKSERFVTDIMGYKNQGGNIYDKKIISLLRKDFWKEFVNEDGTEKV